MTRKKARQLLDKYAKGQATPAEIERVETWYARLQHDPSTIPVESRQAIAGEIFQNVKLAMHAKPTPRKIWLNPAFLKIAAAILLVSGLSFALWKIGVFENQATTFVTVLAKPGETKKLLLEDGTEITLEPRAKLIYPLHFTPAKRTVQLIEGNAFFNVAHETNRPFMVQAASGLKVKVLGTSFRIQSAALQSEISVAVATGKVAVSKANKQLGILTKGQQISYNKNTGATSMQQNTVHDYVALVFNGATVQQVIQKLEYVYSIRIQLSDASISKLKCTANFNSSQQPEEILDILCSLHHIRFNSIQKHKTFKIYR